MSADKNHDYGFDRVRSEWQPIWLRIFSEPSRAIIPRRVRIFKWIKAIIGRVPAEKNIKDSGVISGNLRIC